MGLIRLVLINMKRQIKNPFVLFMTLVFPIVMVSLINSGGFGVSHSSDIGIIDNSDSKYSKELIKLLEEDYLLERLEGDAEEHYDLLRENKLGVIYVIDKNFESDLQSQKIPVIKSYSMETQMGIILANSTIESYIANIIEEDISTGLSNNYIETIINEPEVKKGDSYLMTVLMICYFMFVGGAVLTEDILKLKAQKVLKRTIATNNSDKTILGGIFISAFMIQGILCSISFIVLTLLLNIPKNNLLSGILIIFLSSLVSTSIIVAVTRWIKNANLANMFMIILSLLTFGIAMVSSELDAFENVPKLITRLSVISPFTWFVNIANGENIIVSILIIILMAVVFFTAGSFRLRDFARE